MPIQTIMFIIIVMWTLSTKHTKRLKSYTAAEGFHSFRFSSNKYTSKCFSIFKFRRSLSTFLYPCQAKLSQIVFFEQS